LKAYLTYQDIIQEKTHNLAFLNKLCIEQDNEFQNVAALCNILNRFANDTRYPHKYEVNESDVKFSIGAVETIKRKRRLVNPRGYSPTYNEVSSDFDYPIPWPILDPQFS
jgi:hypothetical protein